MQFVSKAPPAPLPTLRENEGCAAMLASTKRVSFYRMQKVAGSEDRDLYSAAMKDETINMTVDMEQLCRFEALVLYLSTTMHFSLSLLIA